MRSNVLKFAPILKTIGTAANAHHRQSMLKGVLTPELASFICELCHNVIRNKNIKLSKQQLKVLRRHKKQMRQLAAGGSKKVNKQKLLNNQTGGFIGVLLPILGSIVSSIASSIISRK